MQTGPFRFPLLVTKPAKVSLACINSYKDWERACASANTVHLHRHSASQLQLTSALRCNPACVHRAAPRIAFEINHSRPIIHLFWLVSTISACQPHLGMAFDYVIAGGGLAGLVIANRLSENPSINVAVVEPGRDVRDDADVLNVDLAGVTYSPDLDWKFKSIAQPQLGDRVIDHPAGKALGGTTVINGMPAGQA